MSARERLLEQDAPPDSESPAPVLRTGGQLSTVIIKPPLSIGGSHLDTGHSANNPRRDSSPPLRRYDSLAPSQRRGSSWRAHQGSTDGFLRPISQSDLRRPRSPLIHRRFRSPPASHSGSKRFRDGPGFVSTPHWSREREGFNESDSQLGGRYGSRSSPSLRRVSQPCQQGSDLSRRAISPSEDYFYRNDPNISPREGDWICLNPSCGNVNFARRTSCKKCRKYRYDQSCGSSHNTDRGYLNYSPPIDRGSQRNISRYRSPPDDPRDSRTGLIPVQSGRLHFRDQDFRERGRSDRHVSSDWEHRGEDEFVSNRRDLNRRSFLPDNRWIRDNRDRS